jgi:hypothetical protein
MRPTRWFSVSPIWIVPSRPTLPSVCRCALGGRSGSLSSIKKLRQPVGLDNHPALTADNLPQSRGDEPMKRILPPFVVVLVFQFSLLAYGVEPANPQTNTKARSILRYLEKLPEQAEKRLVSGQFTDFRSATHQGLRGDCPAAQAVRLHRIWSARLKEPSRRLRLPAVHRRRTEELPQGDLLPRLARELGTGEEPKHEATPGTPVDGQSRGSAATVCRGPQVVFPGRI